MNLKELWRRWRMERSWALDEIRFLEAQEAARRYCEENPTEFQRNLNNMMAAYRDTGKAQKGVWHMPAFNCMVRIEVSGGGYEEKP